MNCLALSAVDAQSNLRKACILDSNLVTVLLQCPQFSLGLTGASEEVARRQELGAMQASRRNLFSLVRKVGEENSFYR
jgi:hypothetical protein